MRGTNTPSAVLVADATGAVAALHIARLTDSELMQIVGVADPATGHEAAPPHARSTQDFLRHAAQEHHVEGGTSTSGIHGQRGNRWLRGDDAKDGVVGGSGKDRCLAGAGTDDLRGPIP